MNHSTLTSEFHSPRDLQREPSLISLQSGGLQPPFFLIHDVFGNTDIYRDLARNLGLDRPIYGLQPHSQKGYPIVHPNIKDSIDRYCRIILSVQPTGPYLLGGSGFGGALAVEIAQQLYARGHRVGLVALFDSRHPHAAQPRNLSLANGSAMGWWAPLAKIFQRVGNRLQVQLYRAYLERDASLPSFLHQLPLSTILNVACPEYPWQVFHGTILLFRAKKGVGGDLPSPHQTNDPVLGWEKYATLGLELHDIPGTHESMLQEPNVQILAKKLQAALASAVPIESASSKS